MSGTASFRRCGGLADQAEVRLKEALSVRGCGEVDLDKLRDVVNDDLRRQLDEVREAVRGIKGFGELEIADTPEYDACDGVVKAFAREAGIQDDAVMEAVIAFGRAHAALFLQGEIDDARGEPLNLDDGVGDSDDRRGWSGVDGDDW